MKNKFIIALILCSLISTATFAEEDHDHGEHEESSESATITPEVAKQVGIELLKTSSQTIETSTKVNGIIALNQNDTAQIKARYPGIIKSVTKSLGDKVTKGETIATVESNDSLQIYPIKSPINGIVMERNLNSGDQTADQPIMIVADTSKLQAELYIFSKDAHKIESGQKVIIHKIGSDLKSEAAITTILPFAENSSQTITARAIIDNTANKWKPGFTIQANIITSGQQVPLAVKSSAIQNFEGENVVFVNEGESYEKRPIKTGISNDEWVEVTSGLEEGETYVAEGSFTIKAEIGKASAEHQH